MLNNLPRRVGAAAIALAAFGAFALIGASAASAASGTSNEGVTNLVITPDAPSANFSTPGTMGTVSWSRGDGTALQGGHSVSLGEVQYRTWTVPVGLQIVRSSGDCPNPSPSDYTTTCELSADGRTYTLTRTAIRNSTWAGTDWNTVTNDFIRVVSTGEAITGVPTSTYTPWPGLTSASTYTEGTIVGQDAAETPLLAGGVIAGVALAGGGAVLGIRRRRTAA